MTLVCCFQQLAELAENGHEIEVVMDGEEVNLGCKRRKQFCTVLVQFYEDRLFR